MTTEPPRKPMTEDEVHGFSRKLERWVETLDPKEYALIGEILRRASGGGPQDVSGFFAHDDLYQLVAMIAVPLQDITQPDRADDCADG